MMTMAIDTDSPSLLDRTLGNLVRAWSGLSDQTRQYLTSAPRPDLPDEDLERVRKDMEACLEMKADEVAARARAAELGRVYLGLDAVGRTRFVSLMATEFSVDPDKVDAAMDAVREAAGDRAARFKAEAALRRALEPRWRRLLTRFTALPEGVKFLVDMRAEMLGPAKNDPVIAELVGDLRGMLTAWFDVGLLDLRQITWDSSAAVLEKLIAYEAVHEIRSWQDLKNRLDSDRRCFAYFHPNMPDEPLIFVEVALVEGMAASVDEILDEDAPKSDPASADTAIFYSISNAQKGLAGISFGNFLIKRVVEMLRHDFPNLKTFATLSPLPGFGRWLAKSMEAGTAPALTAAERKQLQTVSAEETDASMVADLLGRADWHETDSIADALEAPVLKYAAGYLTREKRSDGGARDPVAHFHLSNGARMERLNWMADRSAKGYEQSAGVMINYLYHLGEIEGNSEGYTSEGRIAQSSRIKALAKE